MVPDVDRLVYSHDAARGYALLLASGYTPENAAFYSKRAEERARSAEARLLEVRAMPAHYAPVYTDIMQLSGIPNRELGAVVVRSNESGTAKCGVGRLMIETAGNRVLRTKHPVDGDNTRERVIAIEGEISLAFERVTCDVIGHMANLVREERRQGGSSWTLQDESWRFWTLAGHEGHRLAKSLRSIAENIVATGVACRINKLHLVVGSDEDPESIASRVRRDFDLSERQVVITPDGGLDVRTFMCDPIEVANRASSEDYLPYLYRRSKNLR